MSTETDEILERLKKITLLEAYELVKQILGFCKKILFFLAFIIIFYIK
jgi:hypothetical protein